MFVLRLAKLVNEDMYNGSRKRHIPLPGTLLPLRELLRIQKKLPAFNINGFPLRIILSFSLQLQTSMRASGEARGAKLLKPSRRASGCGGPRPRATPRRR